MYASLESIALLSARMCVFFLCVFSQCEGLKFAVEAVRNQNTADEYEQGGNQKGLDLMLNVVCLTT